MVLKALSLFVMFVGVTTLYSFDSPKGYVSIQTGPIIFRNNLYTHGTAKLKTTISQDLDYEWDVGLGPQNSVLGFAVQAGVFIKQNLSIGLSINHKIADKTEDWANCIDEEMPDTVGSLEVLSFANLSYKEFSITDYFLRLQYSFREGRRFRPLVACGVGLSHVSANLFGHQGDSAYTFTNSYRGITFLEYTELPLNADISEFSFGFMPELGFDIQLSNHFMITINYAMSFNSVVMEDISSYYVGESKEKIDKVLFKSFKTDISNNRLMLGLRYLIL